LLFSSQEKLDEHQWLCSLHLSSTSSFNAIVAVLFTLLRQNGTDMSLKMPVGSCFSCKYCNTRIAIHNHSSFLHHEKHCLLNPSVAAALSVLRRHRFMGEYCSIGGIGSTSHMSKKARLNDAPPPPFAHAYWIVLDV